MSEPVLQISVLNCGLILLKLIICMYFCVVDLNLTHIHGEILKVKKVHDKISMKKVLCI